MTTPGTVVLVDVYGASKHLVEAFAEAGHEVVRVQSVPVVPPFYRRSTQPEMLTGNIVHDGDLASTVAEVAQHSPMAVLAASEPGVELADALSEALGLMTNGTEHSEARRDKYVQAETLRTAGVRAVRHLLVTDEDELARWHDEIGGRLVVKPIRSAGNDGVTFCETPEDSVRAYHTLRKQDSLFAVRNEGVVAQEYLVGPEFAVNTVSRDGHHRVTDVWKYMKMSANGVVDRHSGALSIAAGEPARETLATYAIEVLDALGVRHGPAHLEVIDTADGPCLVEVGVRLCGAGADYYATLAHGESQVTWTVDAVARPQKFLAEYQRPHRTRQHAAMAYLTSPVSGTLRGYPLLDEVQQLDSFHQVHMSVKPGEHLPRTVGDASEPMMVGLAHPVQEFRDRDFLTLSYLDGHGFYDVEPEHAWRRGSQSATRADE